MATTKTNKKRSHAPKIQDTSNLADTALIRLPTVSNLTGLAASTIWRKVKEGNFPSPVAITGNRVGWVFGSVRQWLVGRDV
jgi:predicted DNA-binding transcriptional regulator AlpA